MGNGDMDAAVEIGDDAAVDSDVDEVEMVALAFDDIYLCARGFDARDSGVGANHLLIRLLLLLVCPDGGDLFEWFEWIVTVTVIVTVNGDGGDANESVTAIVTAMMNHDDCYDDGDVG